MKRDTDLIRMILAATEEAPGQIKAPFEFTDFDSDTISYHIQLLREADLLIATCRIYDSGRIEALRINRLTWAGHEFMDAARNEKVWRRAKQIGKDKGVSMPFDLLKDLLQSLVRDLVLPI